MCLNMALTTEGAAGLSNMVANYWKRILLSKDFSNEGLDLCRAIANMSESLYTSKVEDLNTLEAFLAYSLIPLDKNTSAKPIGMFQGF